MATFGGGVGTDKAMPAAVSAAQNRPPVVCSVAVANSQMAIDEFFSAMPSTTAPTMSQYFEPRMASTGTTPGMLPYTKQKTAQAQTQRLQQQIVPRSPTVPETSYTSFSVQGEIPTVPSLVSPSSLSCSRNIDDNGEWAESVTRFLSSSLHQGQQHPQVAKSTMSPPLPPSPMMAMGQQQARYQLNQQTIATSMYHRLDQRLSPQSIVDNNDTLLTTAAPLQQQPPHPHLPPPPRPYPQHQVVPTASSPFTASSFAPPPKLSIPLQQQQQQNVQARPHASSHAPVQPLPPPPPCSTTMPGYPIRGNTTYHGTTSNTNTSNGKRQREPEGRELRDGDADDLLPAGIRLRAIRSAQSVQEVVDGSILQAPSSGAHYHRSPAVALIEMFVVMVGPAQRGSFCWHFSVRDPTAQEYEQIKMHRLAKGNVDNSSIAMATDPCSSLSSFASPLSRSLSTTPHLSCVYYEMSGHDQSVDFNNTQFVRLVGIPSKALQPPHQQQEKREFVSSTSVDNGEGGGTNSRHTHMGDGFDDAVLPLLDTPWCMKRKQEVQHQLQVVHIRGALLPEIQIAMQQAQRDA